MFIELDLDSDVALYQQLKNKIIEGIAKGELKPGDTLPSMRQLASQLSINTLTVNKAYNQLKADNFLVINRRKNVVINEKEKYKANKNDLVKIEQQIKPIVAEIIARDISVEQFKKIYEDLLTEMRGVEDDR